MAAFINNDITTAGLIVLAKGVAGQKINYTKIVLGDGYLEAGQTPRTLTGVVSPKATVDITKLKINGDGTVAVGGIFTNGDEFQVVPPCGGHRYFVGCHLHDIRFQGRVAKYGKMK